MSDSAYYYKGDPDPNRDCACAAIAGMEVKGSKGFSWSILEKIERKKNSSGGNFSVGYKVRDQHGREAFMKATDTGLIAGTEGNTLNLLDRAISEHKFERQILDFCQGNNMDRVVHALDYGDFQVTHKGSLQWVFFIIFELADGDARSVITKEKGYDFLWALHALHNLAVGVNQLHTKGIAHNDIKPSNVLIFGQALQKLADMGRATHTDIVSPNDNNPCLCDVGYAAPELLYRMKKERYWQGRVPINSRRASDLYLVGSMAYFFVTRSPLTPTIFSIIREEQVPSVWGGSFEEILPYWRDAFGKAMMRFDANLPKNSSGATIPMGLELSLAIKQLCEPAPEKRGHPSIQGTPASQYSLERYISLFDSLFNRFQIVLNR